jgi:hypothetical protein
MIFARGGHGSAGRARTFVPGSGQVNVMDGFAVDVAALERAAAGIDDVLDEIAVRDISGLRCDESVAGDGDLAGALAVFCSAWQRGVGSLIKDGREMAARLAVCAATYRTAEQETRDTIVGGVVRGPAPAARP